MSKPGAYYEQHHAVDANSSTVSMSQILAAGLASVGAAVVTSRFGVAGTILGAALTTMIITGGSAVLKSYLENFSKKVKTSPQKLRAGRFRKQSGRSGPAEDSPVRATREGPGGMTVYGRGGNGSTGGGIGRLGSAFGWFRRLSSSAKRRILIGAAIPAIIAFAIGMGTITGFEAISGQPLSCTFGGNCQVASATGETASRTTFGSLARDASGSTNSLQDSSGGQTQNPAGDSGNDSGGILENIPGSDSVEEAVPSTPSGGETPVYEQPVEEVPAEEVPVEEAPVEEAVPEQPSSGGLEEVPAEEVVPTG